MDETVASNRVATAIQEFDDLLSIERIGQLAQGALIDGVVVLAINSSTCSASASRFASPMCAGSSKQATSSSVTEGSLRSRRAGATRRQLGASQPEQFRQTTPEAPLVEPPSGALDDIERHVGTVGKDPHAQSGRRPAPSSGLDVLSDLLRKVLEWNRLDARHSCLPYSRRPPTPYTDG